jgi:hypothetical protein
VGFVVVSPAVFLLVFVLSLDLVAANGGGLPTVVRLLILPWIGASLPVDVGGGSGGGLGGFGLSISNNECGAVGEAEVPGNLGEVEGPDPPFSLVRVGEDLHLVQVGPAIGGSHQVGDCWGNSRPEEPPSHNPSAGDCSPVDSGYSCWCGAGGTWGMMWFTGCSPAPR